MPLTHLACTKCDRSFEPAEAHLVCPCGAPLFARYDLERAAREMRPGHLALREPSLWRYREVLPLDGPQDRLSLGEGFTPLLDPTRLASLLGLPRLMIKDESGNPTGSFKARGLAVAVSMAKLAGATHVYAPSAGNAGAALAAYAAHGGLRAHVFLPASASAGFHAEVRAYGADLTTVEGSIAEAGQLANQLGQEHGWYPCATFREPYRVEGKKTMGYEIAEQLGWKLPDAIIYPTGGGTGIVGMWKAFDEMEKMGFISPDRPRLFGVQAEGCAPVVKAFAEGRDECMPWPGPTTIADGLRVPKPFADFLILRALRESRGSAIAVSDAEIVQGVKDAAQEEGLLVCVEAGACLSALRKLKASGQITPDDRIVLFNTGAGFKSVDRLGLLP